MRDLERTDYGNPKACRACQLRPRCTNNARSVFRLENEDVLDRMAERLKVRPAILDRRREVVEHLFGSIKQWMYKGASLMRGPGSYPRIRLPGAAVARGDALPSM